MAQEQQFDLAIIGGGPGGYSAAVRAAQLGLRPVVIEEESQLGGVCLNWGCIPTKALLHQAALYRQLKGADQYGFKVGSVEVDWSKVVKRSRTVAGQLARGVQYLMKKNKVQVIQGRGRLTPGKEVEVEDKDGKVQTRLQVANTIIATGSQPRSLPGIEIDGEKILSSREAMVLDPQPKSLVIVGGGAIGIEFAYFYNAFGTEVTLLEALPQILPREDGEIAEVLRENLAQQGIAIHTGVKVSQAKTVRGQVEVTYQGEGGAAKAKGDKLLMAIGVSGNISGMGLEILGVRSAKGAIETDSVGRTNIEGVYAIGDVAGPPQLAHSASAEAIRTVEAIAGGSPHPIDADTVPSCTYCVPQVASVGLTEERAREAGIEVKVGRFPFAASGKAQAIGETEGLVKLIFGAEYGELLGAAIVGPEATELIAELGLALKLEATYEELLQTVHAHPTLSEAVMEAAGEAYGEAINI